VRIRRSDKVGLLTRAIDLITGLHKQLAAAGKGGPQGPGPLPPLGLDHHDDGEESLPDIAAFPSPPSAMPTTRAAEGKKRAAGGRRRSQFHPSPQQHHLAVEGSPVLARGGSKKLAAAAAAATGGSCMWVEVPFVPLDALSRCFAAAPRAAFAVLGCLDPQALAAGRAVGRAWRDWHSQELPWRELCRRRWRLPSDDGPGLEELRAALLMAPTSASWREVSEDGWFGRGMRLWRGRGRGKGCLTIIYL
jgi:hypothetical protein